ncbi:hypothetical protein [uncultured Flavobacterium sp.]|uniref:hypothetical protein n=1 Tax=uncultured Flavobacterium sp. TaxID=165435 RepID=UPI0030EC2669
MKKILFLSIVLIFNSCNKDDADNKISNTSIDLVTGLTLRQTIDDTFLTLGNPNIYTNNIFIIYPNSSTGFLSIASNDSISDVWVIPGNPVKIHKQTDFSAVLNSSLYSESQIQDKSQLELNDINSLNIILDINSLNSGYYKVFVKINNTIYWDNIYLEKNGDENSFNEIINYWN